jgi:hypothetical protein
MALERANPLPPGRYWVDLSPDDKLAFNVWLTQNRGAVAVRAASRDDSSGWEWVLFEVTAPAMAFWNGPGYPTIAAADVTSERDVKQIPIIQGAGPGDFAMKLAIGLAPWALGAVLGVYALKRVFK